MRAKSGDLCEVKLKIGELPDSDIKRRFERISRGEKPSGILSKRGGFRSIFLKQEKERWLAFLPPLILHRTAVPTVKGNNESRKTINQGGLLIV